MRFCHQNASSQVLKKDFAQHVTPPNTRRCPSPLTADLRQLTDDTGQEKFMHGLYKWHRGCQSTMSDHVEMRQADSCVCYMSA